MFYDNKRGIFFCGKSLTVLGTRTGLTLRFHEHLSSKTWRFCVFFDAGSEKYLLTINVTEIWSMCVEQACEHQLLADTIVDFSSFILHQACVILNHSGKCSTFHTVATSSISCMYTETSVIRHAGSSVRLRSDTASSLTCSQWSCVHVFQVCCSLC